MKPRSLQSDVGKPLSLGSFLFNQREKVMKVPSTWYRSALAGIALIAGLGCFTTSAFAQGTAPNTDITNQATLDYAVSGVNQTAVPSNITTFKVDRLVRVVVAEANNNPTQVVPGALAQVTTFTVTNQGNLAQAYTLSGVDLANGQTVTLNAILRTDNLGATGCAAFVENGLTAGYTPTGGNQDTAVAITSLAPGASATVYVVCDIPAAPTAVNGSVAVVALTATTAETAGCLATGVGCVATVQSAIGVADDPNTVQIVFGDTAGSEAADIARDGKHSARDAFLVSAAAITVTKTQFLLCDPVNFNTNPRSIPGAYVRYEITIANAALAASATLQTITDTLNTNLNFDVNLAQATAALCPGTPEGAANSGFKLTCTGGSRACATTPVFYTSAADADAIGIAGQAITANLGAALIVEGTYAAGELRACFGQLHLSYVSTATRFT
jgi:hypothetical protein